MYENRWRQNVYYNIKGRFTSKRKLFKSGKGVRFKHILSHNMLKIDYRIIALFAACTYSRKTAFWEIMENAGVPTLYILWLTSVRLYSSTGACSLRGACSLSDACAKKARQYGKQGKQSHWCLCGLQASVVWNVLPWSRGHWFEPQLCQTWGCTILLSQT